MAKKRKRPNVTQGRGSLGGEARRRMATARPARKGLPPSMVAKPLPAGQNLQGAQWVEGTPGVENPPVQPFLTAGDMSEIADRNAGWDQMLADIESSLSRLTAETNFTVSELEKERVQDLSQSADEMAGRGLFQSSIKDADLYDIEATARLRKDFVDTQLKTARLDAQNQRQIIQDNRDAFSSAINQRMTENAQGVQADQPIWKQEPTEGHWQPQTLPPPPKPPRPASLGPTAVDSQPQGPNYKSEAQARIGGKKGGRGKKIGTARPGRKGLGLKRVGTAGAGSAGIR